jgi:trigger factor
MPTVNREQIALLTDKINVTVTKEDYMPAFEKSLKNYAKNANIPGFRKGMVPTGMVRKMYGAAVFSEEVLRAVERALMGYLQQEKLEIFAQPLPSTDNNPSNLDVNTPGDYVFSFEVGLKPDFKVADLAGKNITRYKVDITDEMVNEEVDRIRQKAGTMTEPEAVGSEEHVLNVSFLPCDADGNPEEGATAVENSLLVKYFSPAFREKLMGLKKDDSVVLTLADAFDEKEREWLITDLKLDKEDPTSIQKSFKMTIAKIGFVEKRELNEEFYNEFMPGKEVKTEEEFRANVKADMQQYWDSQATNHMHHELYHVLNEQTPMEFPEGFLRRWMMEGQEQPKTAEEVEAEFPTFRNQLRWTLVSDRIVQEQGIQVGREEVMTQLRMQVLSYFGGMSLAGSNLEWIDGYVERMMKDEQQVDGAYRRVLTEKIFQWAATQVSPVEKVVSFDEFSKELEAHRHEH